MIQPLFVDTLRVRRVLAARIALVVKAALALPLLAFAQAPPSAPAPSAPPDTATLVAEARQRYASALAAIHERVAKAVQAREKTLRDTKGDDAPRASAELEALLLEARRFEETGVFPNLPANAGWQASWRKARETLRDDCRRAESSARARGAADEAQSIKRDSDSFLRTCDRAPWRRVVDGVDCGTDNAGWAAVEGGVFISSSVAFASKVIPGELRIVFEVPAGQLAYGFSFDVQRVQFDEGLTLSVLDSERRVVDCVVPRGLFSNDEQAAPLHVVVWVFGADVRVEVNGITCFPPRQSRSVARGDVEAPARGVVRIRPDRLARMKVSNLLWKPLFPIGDDLEPRVPTSAPTPRAGLTDADFAALAKARLDYAATSTHALDGMRADLKRALEEVAAQSAAATNDAEREHALKRRADLELAQPRFEAVGDWPENVLPTQTSRARRAWEAARQALMGAYDRVGKTLGNAAAERADAEDLARAREAFRAACDAAPWRDFDRAAMRGVGRPNPRDWIEHNGLYTSPQIEKVESTRTTLVMPIALPHATIDYAVEWTIERLAGDGGFELQLPASDGAAFTFHVPSRAFDSLPGSAPKSNVRRIDVFVFADYVRVDVDGISELAELRDSRRGDGTGGGDKPIEISLTPDGNTQLRLTRPLWKPLRAFGQRPLRSAESSPLPTDEEESPEPADVGDPQTDDEEPPRLVEPRPKAVKASPDEFPRDWFWHKTDEQWASHSQLVGKPMPKLELSHWANGELDLSRDTKGKVVVVDFWATWCPGCIGSIPGNNELFEKHKADGLVFIGVCGSSRGQERFDDVVAERGIQYPVARDVSLASGRQWRVMWWPTYAVVDRKGKLRALGLRPGRVAQVVEKLLAEPSR